MNTNACDALLKNDFKKTVESTANKRRKPVPILSEVTVNL